MRYLICLITLCFSLNNAWSQELNVKVQVNAPKLHNVDPKLFETLEAEISNFFNNTKWTEDEYEQWEKIECNVNLNITDELTSSSFMGDFYVQAVRPIFNSNYKTQTINYADNGIPFEYKEYQPIQNSFNNYTDGFSSLLTYYAYLILGFDYDTYEPSGGDVHFKTALNIINSIPQTSAQGTGWDSRVKNRTSRFNVIEELLDPRTRPYRQAIYEYHLKSLDMMTEDAGKSRAVMMSALTAVNQVHTSLLNSGVIQMFCDTKKKEIVEIYKGAGRGDQSKVFEMMVKMDPARTSDYSAINK